MCWRDDVHEERRCVTCNQNYYGDLGHRNCPGFLKKEEKLEVGSLPSIAYFQTMFCVCSYVYSHDTRNGKPTCPSCGKQP